VTKKVTSPRSTPRGGFSRRGFLAGATVAGLSIIKPELVRGSQANAKIKIGLMGCGGRGAWIAGLFVANGNYEFVGTADYFADRADSAGRSLKVPTGNCFSGLNGYKRLLDTRPDAIAIESTPYFHPEQAAAGVDAGCHVYCAKPIAVDVPGCLSFAETSRKASKDKRCMMVDFQTRANDFYREAVRRVHAGDIGPIVSGEAVYYCDPPCGYEGPLTDPEVRLRYWLLDRALSGDIITEQNIHALDVATWAIDKAPVQAYGTCGKKGRGDQGNCNDHFAVIYTFPGDVMLSFASKQYGSGFGDIGCRMFGPRGSLETHYGGLVYIRGEKSYKGGRDDAQGMVRNIADFHAAITRGDYANPTVAPSVRSNLTTILGRTAAYRKTLVTWDEMIQSAEKVSCDMTGLKA
jgi:myo-inositol 2-dehydrogenase/D-chiro-inositol 1-dehydrogenase